jgi:hypothetical protein
MKITLLLIFLNTGSLPIAVTSSMASSTLTINSAVAVPATTKLTIPMPDLKSCLAARHQIDGYSMLVAAACSADE